MEKSKFNIQFKTDTTSDKDVLSTVSSYDDVWMYVADHQYKKQ